MHLSVSWHGMHCMGLQDNHPKKEQWLRTQVPGKVSLLTRVGDISNMAWHGMERLEDEAAWHGRVQFMDGRNMLEYSLWMEGTL